MSFTPRTASGHDLLEVISALQKTIRRADERQALYWALELVPQYEQYLWRRLCVIAQEDIGPANLQVLLLVPSQRALWFEFRAAGKDSSARLVLANTILALARSPKSREADTFQCALTQGRLQGTVRYDIPDYALDKHTRRGAKLGRDFAHWLDVGCQLEPAPAPDPYLAEARALWPTLVDPAWTRPAAGRGKGAAVPSLEPESEPTLL